jgi:hypothetical protein
MADNNIHFGTGSGEGKGGGSDGVIPPIAGSKEQVDSSKAKRDAVIASRPAKGDSSGSQKARTGGVEGQVFVEQDKRANMSKDGREIKPGAKHGVILAHQQTSTAIVQGHVDSLMPHRDAHPVLAAMLDKANGHLAAAQPHIARAAATMRGIKVDGVYSNQQHKAPEHLNKSHEQLALAQDTMSNAFMQHVTQHFGVSAGHSGDSLSASAGGLGIARTKRTSNDWKENDVAGKKMPRGVLINPMLPKDTVIDPSNPNHVALVKDAMGVLKGTTLGEKVNARPTPRGKRAAVFPNKRAGSSSRETRYRSPAVNNSAQVADYQPKSPIGPVAKPGTMREGK